jgi:hypothetical protein
MICKKTFIFSLKKQCLLNHLCNLEVHWIHFLIQSCKIKEREDKLKLIKWEVIRIQVQSTNIQTHGIMMKANMMKRRKKIHTMMILSKNKYWQKTIAIFLKIWAQIRHCLLIMGNWKKVYAHYLLNQK